MELSLPGLFTELGWVAIVVFVVILIITGRLRTNREVEELRKDRDRRIEELSDVATTFREAYEAEKERREKDKEAVHQTLKVSEMTLQVVSSLAEAVDNENSQMANREEANGG